MLCSATVRFRGLGCNSYVTITKFSLIYIQMVHYHAGSGIRRWVNCGQEGMCMTSNDTQIGCGIQETIDWY